MVAPVKNGPLRRLWPIGYPLGRVVRSAVGLWWQVLGALLRPGTPPPLQEYLEWIGVEGIENLQAQQSRCSTTISKCPWDTFSSPPTVDYKVSTLSPSALTTSNRVASSRIPIFLSSLLITVNSSTSPNRVAFSQSPIALSSPPMPTTGISNVYMGKYVVRTSSGISRSQKARPMRTSYTCTDET